MEMAARSARTAELVNQLHAIEAELENMHTGRRFRSTDILWDRSTRRPPKQCLARLRPGSSPGHDPVADDGRSVEIKASYGTTGVGIRPTSHDHANVLVVLRSMRIADVPHEVVYNGAFAPHHARRRTI